MNKKLLFLTLTITFIFFSGCGKAAEHSNIDAKTPSFETLSEMEDYSDTIIRCVREKEEQPMIEKGDNGAVYSCYTLSQVKVTEIYKDEFDTLEAGNMITILENEVFDSDENIVYHTAGYNMMEAGKAYLLFLRRNTLSGEVYYVSSGVNFGTVSLENDNRMVQHIGENGSGEYDFSYFQSIWDAAIEKYTVKE